MGDRFYIATKWENRGQARRVKDDFEACGFVSSYNWMDVEQESSAQAEADMHGVRSANFLVILAEQQLEYRGAYSELGAALALRIPVFIVGPGMDRNIFSKHKLVTKFATLQDLYIHFEL